MKTNKLLKYILVYSLCGSVGILFGLTLGAVDLLKDPAQSTLLEAPPLTETKL